MGKIIVNCDSISSCSEKIKAESKKLIDILEAMKKDSLEYEKMINSKAGDLYKDVMIRELEKEKNIIVNNSEEITRRFSWISNTYQEMIEEIKGSIGK